VPVSVSSCSDDGKLFQALGPAQENECSPNFRRVRCRSYRWLLVEGRRGREDFLLVINTNLPLILHRFQIMADHVSNFRQRQGVASL